MATNTTDRYWRQNILKRKLFHNFVGDRALRNALITSIPPDITKERVTWISELPLRIGSSRADLVLMDQDLKAFEIKSDFDSLRRLPSQIGSYSRVFDQVTLLCGRNHLREVSHLIPEWWGLIIGFKTIFGGIELVTIRQPTLNPNPDNYALTQLLWREELEICLSTLRGNTFTSSPSRQLLCRELASLVDHKQLKSIVSSFLLHRRAILTDVEQRSCDG